MHLNEVKDGMRVRVTKLEDTKGLMISPKNTSVRRVGAIGTIRGYVPGHGGDVWWVKHDDADEVGAYVFTEFEPLPNLASDKENRT